MLGKLLKYDFRSMLKQFAFVWPAALVLGLINRFTINHFVTSTSALGETVSGIAMLVYIAILVTMFVLAVVFVIQRFYKGLLGDEGYLMHTLPVRPWQLLASKLICSLVLTVGSILMAILSILLIIPLEWRDFQQFWQSLGEVSRLHNPHFALFLLEVLVLILVGTVASYLRLYLAMAIGHLFHKNRVVWSVVAYIGINVAINILTSVTGSIAGGMDRIADKLFVNMSSMSTLHTLLWSVIAGLAVISAAYFAITNYILGKKLNLE